MKKPGRKIAQSGAYLLPYRHRCPNLFQWCAPLYPSCCSIDGVDVWLPLFCFFWRWNIFSLLCCRWLLLWLKIKFWDSFESAMGLTVCLVLSNRNLTNLELWPQRRVVMTKLVSYSWFISRMSKVYKCISRVLVLTKPKIIGWIVPHKTETHVEPIPANVFSRELLQTINSGFIVC